MAKTDSTQVPLAIQSVYLRSSNLYIDDNFDPLLPGQELAGLIRTGEIKINCKQVHSSPQEDSPLKLCEFRAQFDFAYTDPKIRDSTLSDEDVEKSIIAQVKAEFSSTYVVNTPDFPDMDFLVKWAQGNVILHVWPYWREFCQAALQRMNLPLQIIPLIQIGNHAPANQEMQKDQK